MCRGALMAEYYAQRATAGLIIAEATMAMEGNSAFYAEPGIYSEAQVAGWKAVTDAVHGAGGTDFSADLARGTGVSSAVQQRRAAGGAECDRDHQ